jgi:isoleucyl-tRNA synthetase
MHGLPIETKVEEELGFKNKKDLPEYGEEERELVKGDNVYELLWKK